MKQYFFLCALFVVCCWKYLIVPFGTNGTTARSDACVTESCLRSAKFFEKSINESADPCDDFYKFACGNVLMNNVSSGTIEDRRSENSLELQNFFRKNNSDTEPVAVHKTRKLFNLCLDTDGIDRKGMQPLKNLLDRIGVSLLPHEKFDLVEVTSKVSRFVGIDIFYNIGVLPNPFNQTENKISIARPSQEEFYARVPTYFKTQMRGATEMSKNDYIESVLKVLCELCENKTECYSLYGEPSIEMERLKLYMNRRTAAISKPYSRDSNSTIPRIYTLKHLQNLTNHVALQYSKPALNWTRNIELIFTDADTVTLDLWKPEIFELIMEEQYMEDILNFIYSYNDSDHETGMVWEIADTLAQYLPSEIRDLKMNYSDTKSRADWCTMAVSHILGMATSYYYAINETYKLVKKDVSVMVTNIQNEFEDSITSSSWIDSTTRERALQKLKSIKKLLGYPATLADRNDLDSFYKDLNVTTDFLESVLQRANKEATKDLKALNKINNIEIDRRILTPIEVNAFYDPERNTIIIPAGVLGVPLYGHGLQSINYGLIGHIVGHEITHGFDSLGRRYNQLGNLEEWWNPETLKEFNKKADCFKKTYQTYSEVTELVNLTTDGTVTLPENIADNGGFKQAFHAYRNYVKRNGKEAPLIGYEHYSDEQLFTIAFASLWCENPIHLQHSMASPEKYHSPNAIRVNGVVMNSAEFSRIWNCPKGSKMNPDTDKCQLW